MRRATHPKGNAGTSTNVSSDRWISQASSGLIEVVSGGNLPWAKPGFLGEISNKNLSQKDCCPSQLAKGGVSMPKARRKTLPRPNGICTNIGLTTGSDGSDDSRMMVCAEYVGVNFAISFIRIGNNWLTNGVTQRFKPLSVRNPLGFESNPSILHPVTPRARSNFFVLS